MGEQGRTIQEMGALAGVSARTLRLYDEKRLLQPKRNASGYRVYTEEDERRLQQILLWRACGMPLGEIKRALASPEFDEEKALEEQMALLEEREEALRRARECAERTLGAVRKGKKMKTEERFSGLKEAAIEKNEKLYGAEARKKYGNEAVDAASDAVRNMTEGEWQDLGALEKKIIEELKLAMEAGDPSSPEAEKLVRDQAAWVQAHWGKDHPLTHEMHVGLGEMYVADPRFAAYYDTRAGEGAAAFLAAAIEASAF